MKKQNFHISPTENKKLIFNCLKVILFFSFIDFIWTAFSITYLEMGSYEWELQTKTEFNGATFLYLLLIFIFLLGLSSTFYYILRNAKRSESPPILSKSFLLISILLPLYFLSQIPIKYTIYDKHLIDRINFSVINYYWFLPFFYLYFGYFCSHIYTFKRLRNILFLIAFITNTLTIILTGNKYSLLASAFSFFAIGFSIRPMLYYRPIRLSKIILPLGIIFFITISLYSINLMDSNPDWFIFIIDRVFNLQGGLWWATYRDWVENKFEFNHLISYWKQFPNENNITIKFLMSHFLGLIESRTIIDNHSIYSGGFPAVFLLLSNNLLIVITFVLFYGVGLGFLYGSIVKNLLIKNFIEVFFLFLIFLNFSQLHMNGDFSNILSSNFFIKLLLYFSFILIKFWIKGYEKRN
jgi:hypothetical protein